MLPPLRRLLPLLCLMALGALGACAHGDPEARATLPALPKVIELPSGPMAQEDACAQLCANVCVYGCTSCAGLLQRNGAAPIEVRAEEGVPAPGPSVALAY